MAMRWQSIRSLGALTVFVGTVSATAGQQWQQPRTHEHLLPESVDCWEPTLAIAPTGQLYVVAGKRHGMPKDSDFEQQQVIWRSDDGGASFEGPRPLTTEGLTHSDERIAVDAKSAIYVSYMDWVKDANGRRSTRLRLARSRDAGRTFSIQTVTLPRIMTTSRYPRRNRIASARCGWMIAAAPSTCGPDAQRMRGGRGALRPFSQTGPTARRTNQQMGSKRSTVAKRGVGRGRLLAKGCGALRPLNFGNTIADRAMNRRAELVRLTPILAALTCRRLDRRDANHVPMSRPPSRRQPFAGSLPYLPYGQGGCSFPSSPCPTSCWCW